MAFGAVTTVCPSAEMLDNGQMPETAETQPQYRTLIIGALLLSALFGALYLVVRPEPPPDFQALPAGPDRKQAFFSYFTPLVHQANAEIARQRDQLEAIAALDVPDKRATRQLAKLAIEYNIEPDAMSGEELLWETLRRVDQLPASLVLAQAAKESGWGSSRFAVEANNYFGQRCWTSGCGITPKQRPEGARFEVARFDSPYASVRAYLRNLNTHHEYQSLRDYRASVRSRNDSLSGLLLADHLGTYSEREAEYREEIKNIITVNRLETIEP